jgi:hypothetical protein
MKYKKRDPEEERREHPCRCGSGLYCRRHLCYGLPSYEREEPKKAVKNTKHRKSKRVEP